MSDKVGLYQPRDAVQEADHGFRPDAITMYGFQVQALGVLGYSDWSTTETIVVN